MASSQNMQNDTPALTTLSYAGDVILKPSGHGKPAIRLLCSSICLGHGSSVFKAMFEPDRFAEGQTLSVDSPPEIPLPEDHPQAIERLCKILHFRSGDDIAWDIDHYADVAIVSEKYDCRDAVVAWFQMSVPRIWAQNRPFYDEKLPFVSYVLGLPSEFAKVTKRIILSHTKALNPVTATHKTDLVPLELLQELETRRQVALQNATDALKPEFVQRIGLGTMTVAAMCPRERAVADSWLHNLISSGLLFMPLVQSVEAIKFRVDGHFAKLPIEHGVAACSSNIPFWQGRCGCQTGESKRDHLSAEIGFMITMTKGMCLDCFYRKVSDGAIDRHCRVSFDHDGMKKPES
ncbi:uncharacterized protein N0V89_010178 [Didymosphaeria variabile]|uniref:BTB domain-containing protein n=1 Tax=Didymosphaeria variabile TaxID=1932322 RepID=A0A9W8XFD1_9PLEO|nr:uncharacterized protein N0V89_010178 [Didymosphaeria variabile]KAJ4348800.1 hypothetical protein N0V89_010178 [Didymosphaeria variabile]